MIVMLFKQCLLRDASIRRCLSTALVQSKCAPRETRRVATNAFHTSTFNNNGRLRTSASAFTIQHGVHKRPLSSALSQQCARSFSTTAVASAATPSWDDTSFDRAASLGVKREPMKPYPLSDYKSVPSHVARPPYADTGMVPYSSNPDTIFIHDDPEFLGRMTAAAKVARKGLNLACSLAKPGITTDEIDTAVHEALIANGAYPSPLNYAGFPKSLCSSINEVICHGIPDLRPLQMGDIVSFDVSCFVGGVHGDNCATVIVGDEPADGEEVVSKKGGNSAQDRDWRGVPYKTQFDSEEQKIAFVSARRLVHAARQSLYAAIEAIGPGACLSDIGGAIQDVADAYGYSTIAKYRGHGISDVLHCAPFVKHYRNSDKLKLVPGMIFTIEPMLVEGSADCFEWSDEWTVVTADGAMAAQFEHTVLITDTGVEILTVSDDILR